jgi:hypothetical protein
MQTPDTKPGPYYVTAMLDDSSMVYPMAGPYADHAAALADVERCRSIAESVDRRALWAAFGTCRMPTYAKPGKLNQLGLV